MNLRSFINRVRSRKEPTIEIYPQGPTDDWAAGDLGEVIGTGSWAHIATGFRVDGPRRGTLVRVTRVSFDHGIHSLGLEGWGDALWTGRLLPQNPPEAARRQQIGLARPADPARR